MSRCWWQESCGWAPSRNLGPGLPQSWEGPGKKSQALHLLVIVQVVREKRSPHPFVFGVAVMWESLGLGCERRHEFRRQRSGVWLMRTQEAWKTRKADPGVQGRSGI